MHQLPLNICYSLNSLKNVFRIRRSTKLALVSSKKILKINAWAVKKLEGISHQKISIITVPDGETAKTWVQLERLLNAFILHKLDRKSCVLAMGGGSVGDLTGFACAIYLRGIPFIQIPTTLLAQVDSSLGGKTGVDFRGYKNQIGVFYAPVAICSDFRFIKTLSNKQITNGLAEIIKMGFIKDARIIRLLEKENLKRESVMRELIRRATSGKLFYERKDPFDINERQALNFGHTIGHAIEMKNNFSHGIAVLIGMREELRILEKLGLVNPLIRKRLENLLYKLKIAIPSKFKMDRTAILHDKKRTANNLTLPIIVRVGTSKLVKISLKSFLAEV